jgi:branched-chain amino acid transport system permease protein
MDLLRQLVTDPVGFYNAHQLLVGQCGVNVLLALSIWLTLYSGQLTLANVGFMAIGGYTSVILAIHAHAPLALGILAGVALASLVALVIGVPVLRLRGVFLAIATVGFGEAVRFGVILNLGITGKGQGLNNPTASPGGGIAPVWISVAVVTYLCWRMTESRTGLAWSAIRTDELAAAAHGVDVRVYKLAAFVAGAALAAYAGALDAHLNFFIDPTEYAFNRAVLVLVFAVVGGITTAAGPVVGALLLTLLPEVIRSAADYRDALYGAILIAIIVFRPAGLVARRRGHEPRQRPEDSAPDPARAV